MSFKPYGNKVSSEYKFVWGDEFEGDTLNLDKWTIAPKMGGNERVKLSSDPDTIYVKDGKLHLVAQKTEDGNYKVPKSVITQDTMNYKYGYAEIKAKVPYMKGVWPSYWTQSTAERRIKPLLEPNVKGVMAEVDVFEIFANNRVAANYIKWVLDKDSQNPEKPRTWYYANAFRTQARTFTEEEFKTLNDEYHVYGYEWTEDFVRMYFDGEIYAEFQIKENYTKEGNDEFFEDTVPIYNDRTGADMSCFHDPQYLIFNNHLFDEGVSTASTSVTEFPEFTSATYSIEYCRVFKKEGYGDFKAKSK